MRSLYRKLPLLFTLFVLSGANLLAQSIPSNGLIAYYPFNSNANDISGNNYNLTVSGANLCNDRFGNINAAYEFNGASSLLSYYTTLPTNADFTYACWVYCMSDGNAVIIHNGNSDANGYGLLEDNGNTTVGAIGHNISFICSNVNYGATISINLNSWNHIAYRRTGNTIDYFFNGIRIDSRVMSYLTPNGKFHLGIDYTDNSNPFHGRIDDVAVYNRALDSLEILQLYSGCTSQIISQPVSIAAVTGNTARFYITTNNTTHTSQWQADGGAGFVNLSNAGPYSGVQTDTLTINNVNTSSNNFHYRCIVNKTTGCRDTSNSAILYVWSAGINETIQNNAVKIFPNPSYNEVHIQSSQVGLVSSVELINMFGQTVWQKTATENDLVNYTVQLPAAGTYLLKIYNHHRELISYTKLVRL